MVQNSGQKLIESFGKFIGDIMGDMSVDVGRIAHAIGSALASGVHSIGKLGGRAIDAMPKLPSLQTLKNIFSGNTQKQSATTQANHDSQVQHHTTQGPAQRDQTVGTASEKGHESLELLGEALTTGHPPGAEKTESKQETHSNEPAPEEHGTKDNPNITTLPNGNRLATWMENGRAMAKNLDAKSHSVPSQPSQATPMNNHAPVTHQAQPAALHQPAHTERAESKQPETPAVGQGGYVYGTKDNPNIEQMPDGQWAETWKGSNGVVYMRPTDGKPSEGQTYEWGTKDNPKIEQLPNGRMVATWQDESGGRMRFLDDVPSHGQQTPALNQQPTDKNVGMHGPTVTSHHSHSGLPEGPRDWNALENATWDMVPNMRFQTGLPQNFDDIQSPAHTAISVSVGNGERPVHANMINALDGKQYIATEAPIHQDPTVNSQKAEAFWLMAHQHSSVIVDLTNSHDKHNGVAASHNYPTQRGETKNFGSVSVTCTSVSNSQDVPGTKVYTYSVYNKATGQSKDVTRLNYEKWPDFGTASEHDVLKLTDLMSQHAGGEPPIVHCRAGVGRTGSVIATAVLKNLVQENKISEDNINSASGAVVLNLRAQRGPVTVQRDAQFTSVMTATRMAIEAHQTAPRLQLNNLNTPITLRQPPQGATNFYHELAGQAAGTFTVRPSKEGGGAITIDVVKPGGETVSHRMDKKLAQDFAQNQEGSYPGLAPINRAVIGLLQATYPGLTNLNYHSGE